jgi:hypothetical protein
MVRALRVLRMSVVYMLGDTMRMLKIFGEVIQK